eukprot:495252_1
MTLGNIKNVVEDNKENECLCKKQKIFPLIWNKFEMFRKAPNIRQRVKFDKISNYLKRFFMEESKDEKDVKSGDAKWVPSFDEITRVYPDVEEIHFINEYTLTSGLLDKLKKHIEKKK